jgi:hypothetical protein
MHADIHLQLHALHAIALQRQASAAARAAATADPADRVAGSVRVTGSVRVRVGWRLVELGLRLATPADRPVTLVA